MHPRHICDMCLAQNITWMLSVFHCGLRKETSFSTMLYLEKCFDTRFCIFLDEPCPSRLLIKNLFDFPTCLRETNDFGLLLVQMSD